jgi:hypothetical protein
MSLSCAEYQRRWRNIAIALNDQLSKREIADYVNNPGSP